MEAIEISDLKNEFKLFLDSRYTVFIKQQIKEVDESNFLVDFSKYTSNTVTEPTKIISEFLVKKNINDIWLTGYNGLTLSLMHYLELDTLEIRKELDTSLFKKIIEHNIKFNNEKN
jgi:hypothetical protein